MAVRRHLVALLAVVSLIAGFTISSASSAGALPPSPTVPAAPTSLVAYRGNGSAEIGFTAGATGGAAITNYKYSTDNGSSWTAFSPAVTTPTVTIEGLTNDTTYSVKLRAVNSVGDGAVSDAVSVTPADVNAISWTGRSAPEANQWDSVVFGNGLFVAVGWSYSVVNRVMTSPDGVTWTARSAPSSQWRSVTYGNGLFVAVADYNTDRVMTSPDGITWTARTPAAVDQWVAVTYGNGLFVAVASSSNAVMTSPDGVTWTARTGTSVNYWKSVTYGNGLFVAVGSSGGVMTSPDGITWTSRSAAEANNWSEVTYAKGTFVAVSNNGTNRAMTSTDGVTWTARSTPGSDDAWQSLTYGNGNFVSASYSNVMYSTDGTTWAIRPGGWNNFGGLAYGNGKFVAVALGNSPVVMTAGLTTPTTPDAPTSLATTIAKGSTSVRFTKGADGGSTITNYEYQLNDSGPWTALSPADAYSPVTISGLTNGTSYTVKLRAVNSLGAGTASSASAPFTPLQRLVTPAQAGTLSILAGTGSWATPTPGPATSSALGTVNGLVVDPSGNIYIADGINNQIYKITSGGTLSVFAGTGAEVPWGSAPPVITPGAATSADLSGPSGLAVDASGNVYAALRGNSQVVKITPGGTLSIIAGTGAWVDPMDWSAPPLVLVPGPATSVDLNAPTGVAVDASGNLFILDSQYRQVLKVTTGGTLSVVAGTGNWGTPTPGPATSSNLQFPSGIAVDSSGNLYIAEAYQVLKVTTGGTLSVVAGTGNWGTPTPGPATSSNLKFPSGIAVDSSGNLYIADSGAYQVLKVTTGGTLSVVAGTGSSGLPTPGPATSSKLGSLTGIAVDANDNVFVSDSTNNVIEKITAAGALTVVAGTGYAGAPIAGSIADTELGGSTNGVATDAAGNLYVFDGIYYLLEKVTFAPSALAPAAPTSLVATSGDGSASIAFTAGSDGGAEITKYQVKVGAGAWTDVVGTTSPITVTGLTNYATVSVRLRAVNSVGAGAASTAVQVWPRLASSALTSVKVEGTSKIRAAFAALTPVGGSVSHYWVYAYAKGTNTVVGSCRSTAAARGCLIPGLAAGTEYDVAVRGFFTLTGSPTVLPTLDSARQTVRTNS